MNGGWPGLERLREDRIFRFHGNGHHNYCGYLTVDGKAVMGGEYRWDIWDPQTKLKLKEGSVSGGHVYSIVILPKTNRLVAGMAAGMIWMFDLETCKKIMSLKGHDKPLGGLVASPDEKLLLSVDHHHTVPVWRISN